MPERRRIVLYYPQQWPRRRRSPYSRWTQDLPLSLLAIAAWPLRDGYEVVLVDGTRTSAEEAHRRVVDACDGALLYATTGILGPQVVDAQACSARVRARHPDLPAFVGGWFASVAPELELASGLYDAVVLGQGELTFRDVVAAVAAGEPLEGIAGLALERDGRALRTPARPVAGWDALLDLPWQLLDPEDYFAPQRAEADRGTLGGDYGPGRPALEISYHASYGCPIQCTFCASPEVTALRWRAMPAGRMLDDLQALQERWGFEGVEFYDANFGVDERRVRAFAEGLLARGLRLRWFAYLQAASILRYDPATLDAMAAAGLYRCIVGGEAGSTAMREQIRKPTRAGGNVEAARLLGERGVWPRLTYILGYPGEGEASMRATLDEARQVTLAHPRARAEVWPYRPIPGTVDYRRALELGYRPPTTLEGWAAVGDYWSDRPWPGSIPPRVERARELLMHYASLAQGRVRARIGWWERRARRRLERGSWERGRLEARAFHAVQRLVQSSPPR